MLLFDIKAVKSRLPYVAVKKDCKIKKRNICIIRQIRLVPLVIYQMQEYAPFYIFPFRDVVCFSHSLFILLLKIPQKNHPVMEWLIAYSYLI